MIAFANRMMMNVYYNFVLLADEGVQQSERMISFLKLIIGFAPIVWALDLVGLWFNDNKEFVVGFVVIVIFNGWYGVKKHRKLGTLDYKEFLRRTMETLTYVILTYWVLYIMNKIAGENLITESFGKVIQVSTLFYPASKFFKSLFVVSDGKHPPQWVMEKMYNFEKNGDLKKFLNTDNENNNNQ